MVEGPSRHADARVDRVVRFFEALSRGSLTALDRMYAAQARFVDPFNDVIGVATIAQVFTHMFDTLEAPRFEVLDIVAQDDQVFLTWDFKFRLRRAGARPMCIHGGSHLRFAPDGRIILHRDYWDAAQELYAKLPVIGALMRWLRRRMTA